MQFDTFISIYSLCYLDKSEVKETLKKFSNTKYLIIAEPENREKKSIAVNRIPEFSYDYHDIINDIYPDKFICLRTELERANNNLKSVLLFMRKV